MSSSCSLQFCICEYECACNIEGVSVPATTTSPLVLGVKSSQPFLIHSVVTVSLCVRSRYIGKDLNYPTGALHSILEQPNTHTAAAAAYHSAAVPGRSSNKLTAVACGNFLPSPDTVRFGHTLSVLICWLILFISQ